MIAEKARRILPRHEDEMVETAAERVYRRHRDISFQDYGGEGLLVVPRQALQIVLNGTSLRVLQLVDGKRSAADIAAVLATEYEQTPAPGELVADVASALGELSELGAIEPVPAA
ncbi:MAG: PqqD family protein [Acidobacteria bacterium]|nr:PqqD family protein [Acidobacteriota bacterium]